MSTLRITAGVGVGFSGACGLPLGWRARISFARFNPTRNPITHTVLYLWKLFRDLFIRNGLHYDSIYDWTALLKDQETGVRN